MKTKRALTIAATTLVLIAACGRAPAVQTTVPGEHLYDAVSTRGGALVNVIDARTHATIGVLPLGTASADWKHYYAVRSGVLEDIDPGSGLTLNSLTLFNSYDLPRIAMDGMTGGLSQNGHWLVLEMQPGDESHLLVVAAPSLKKAIPVDLVGSYAFDGISDDGQRLYLLHYLQGSDYQVRFYNLRGGYLDPAVIIDKFDPSEPMTGQRLSTVASSDGATQFTVYARAKKGAFIHVLSMDAPYSLCVELPGTGWETDPGVFRWTLALSPDGTRLYAANGALGLLVELAASGENSPSILRIQPVPRHTPPAGIAQPVAATELSSGGAVVSPDGRAVAMAGDTGVVWIDTASLQVLGSALPDWTVWSMGMSPDGRTLYAVRDSGQIARVSADHTVLETFDPKAGRPLALMHVEASS